ncbi:MAG: ATP-binding protein, partial [Bermanella sp.]
MIKPSWDVFRAKFSDNPQFNFEWFCYLLFSKEYNKPYGIFRYKNQSAIETNPIEVKDQIIGFQAKFYDTTLSKNKPELISMLVKAKRDYPGLTKLIVYTNQEWAQAYPTISNPSGQAQKPTAQIEIEDEAKNKNIVLEWRTQSYFESVFVTHDCSQISKYFFQEENSLQNLVKKQDRHTESILRSIKEEMLFSGNGIAIERPNILDSLTHNTSQVAVVCGKGGIGKTVEIKKLYKATSNSKPIYAFKASEFELDQLDDLVKQGEVEDFLMFFGDSKDKIIIIDSAEKLLDLKNQDPVKEFISLSVEHGWNIIFTTREHYFDDLNYLCVDILGINPLKIYVPELSSEELTNLSSIYNFKLPKDERLQQLIRIPFYLNEYLRFYDDQNSEPFNFFSFKERLWNKKIKNGDIQREKVFTELAIERANVGKFYLSVEPSQLESAKSLSHDEILGTDGPSFFISHDIYEEWALEKHINIEFMNKISTNDFFDSIGQSLSIRRSFRNWLSDKLRCNEPRITSFIEKAIDESSIHHIWKDELIVSILLSDYSTVFFENFRSDLLKNELTLLKRICFILRIACKELDNTLLSLIGLELNKELSYSLFLTKPKGDGWKSLIDFVYINADQIGVENLRLFTPVLYEWNSSNKSGETTKKASLLCLQYYKELIKNGSHLSSG